MSKGKSDGIDRQGGEPAAACAGPWLSGLIGSLCGQVEADLRRMPGGEAVSVHALRVRMKKLRALLLLCEGSLTGASRARIHGQIRDLRKSFGGRRDAEVIEKLVAKLQRKRPLPPLVLALGADEGSEGGEGGEGGQLLELLPQVRGQLAALECDLAEMDLLELDGSDLLDGYVGCYRACRRAWKASYSKPCAKRLHRWRKRVKELYFLSLALHPLAPAADCVAPARRLGKRLGKINDLALLEGCLTGAGAEPWKQEVERRKRRLEKRVFAEAEGLFGRKPKALRRELEAAMEESGGWWGDGG